MQRHQKISRITVRQNHNEGAAEGSAWNDESNQLEKIDESQMLMMAANRGAIAQRRNKPFSAN